MQDISRAVPDAAVDGRVGRRSSFEITLNGQLLFSKLEIGRFPVHDDIIAAIKDYKEGSKVTPVTNSESLCVIL